MVPFSVIISAVFMTGYDDWWLILFRHAKIELVLAF
jgi:hypothetical protein